MFTSFFIHRPIFSAVIALAIVLAGLVSIPLLPIAEYPQITPPTVMVTASYPGANAQTVAETVTTPMEEQINGVEGMISVASVSTDNGTSTITVTFEIGYDLDIAAVDVQNRVALAQSQLPQQVVSQGISIKKQSTDLVMVVSLVSPDQSRDLEFISNYASIHIVDTLKRVPGVGNVAIFGQRTYSMRVWLDSEALAGYQLIADDVANAIQAQNAIAPVGSIGAPPSSSDQVMVHTVEAEGRLSEVEQFENIVVRVNDDGSLIYVKDIATVELGAEDYSTTTQMDGVETIGLGVYQLPTANALTVAEDVRATLEMIAQDFPTGLSYSIPVDTTDFVRTAALEVVWTLLIALALVLIVVFVFLQHWRTTLIPMLAVPVSIIGTFALIAALGFSINLLTLFGLVLAIGLVVDDAIVVVENVSRLVNEGRLDARTAAVESMKEVLGPVTASTLVMMAVFIPAALMPGITGQLYQQFALTIACSLALSYVAAVSLTPALAALLIKRTDGNSPPVVESPTLKQRLVLGSERWASYFNRYFDRFKIRYARWVEAMLRSTKQRSRLRTGFWLLIVLVLALFFFVPGGFVPEEDQGYLIVVLELPAGAALARTEQTVDKAMKTIRNTEGVEHVFGVSGLDLLNNTNSYNSGVFFVILKDYDKRPPAEAIVEQLRAALAPLEEALAIPMNPPPIAGLSTTGGFDFVLQDRAGSGEEALFGTTWAMIGAAAKRVKVLGPLFSTFQIDAPRLYLDIDHDKAMSRGVTISSIYNTLQANLGSLYVNDFNKYGQTYRVYLQAQSHQRSEIDDIGQLYVRNSQGEMVPIAELASISRKAGANIVTRYNLFNATHILGSPAAGHSSGEALWAMKLLAEHVLPEGFGYEWTGTAYQQEKAGHIAPIIFGLSLLVVFLIIAALYESWLLPLVILLAVPMAMFGALGLQWARGLENDVYCQIALIMLIGLAAKNAILIVQFANDKLTAGSELIDAIVYACKTRLRPILMTAFAFILGVTPLVFASGAGAASRHSLGTAVFGGMIASTVLSLVFVPVIYYWFQTWRVRRVEGRGRKAES